MVGGTYIQYLPGFILIVFAEVSPTGHMTFTAISIRSVQVNITK